MRLDLGRIPSASASSRRGRRARRSPPVATACACTCAGCAAPCSRARPARRAVTTLTVRAPAPAPAPLPDAAGHVFPVGRPARLRRRLRRARATATRTRARTSRPPRACPSSRPSPARSPSPTTRRSAAGYYIVEKGADGYDYFFAHCQKASVGGRARRRPCSPASRCATSARRATRRGRICTSRLGRADGGSMRSSHPIDPLPLLQELGRQRNASRSSPVTPVSSARAQAVRSPTRARMSSGIWVARTLERRRAVSAPAAPGGSGRGRRGRRRAQVRGRVVGEHERAAVDAGAGDELAVLRDRVGAVALVDAQAAEHRLAGQPGERVDAPELGLPVAGVRRLEARREVG